MDRFLKCPVCCVKVPLSYLHEHYETHFDGAPIKASPETKNLVKTKSPTSTELQQERKNVETRSNNKSEYDDPYEGCKKNYTRLGTHLKLKHKLLDRKQRAPYLKQSLRDSRDCSAKCKETVPEMREKEIMFQEEERRRR